MSKAFYIYVQNQYDQSLTKDDALPSIAYTDFEKAIKAAKVIAKDLYQQYSADQPEIEFNEYLEETNFRYSAEIGESFDVYAEVEIKVLEIV